MIEKRNLICIGCPMGCSLEVTIDDKDVIEVKGNTCKIGAEYGKKECTNPTRVVTSTLKVNDGDIGMVPVKTERDIPKGKIFEAVKTLKGLTINAPIKVGQVLVENIAGTGVNLIATRTVKMRSQL